MLQIKNLSINVDQKTVVKNCDLLIAPGTVHALMGPNGSGKSSLAYTLMGHPLYQVTDGTVTFQKKNLLDLPVDQRARAGLFLSFQYPQALPGVTVFSFLKEAYCAIKDDSVDVKIFEALLKDAMNNLKIDLSFMHRYMNDGFSGGEKKRFELLQMMLLQPKLAILDEIDSGLDLDALKIVAHGVQTIRAAQPSMSLLLITHYQRILDYIVPDIVHVMCNGTIVQSGEASLVHQLEQEGYHGFQQTQ